MSWYKTGTVNVTKNSKIVTGAGTKWTNQLSGVSAGRMLILQISNQIEIYEIESVQSDTQLTLSDNYSGETIKGLKYTIPTSPSVSIEQFALEIASSLAYHQKQLDGWQKILTGSGDVNLTAPDGQNVTIKSQKSLSSAIDNAVKKSGDTMTGELYINGQPVLTKRSYGIGISHVLGDESIDEKKNQYSGFLFTQQQSKGEKPFNYGHVMRSAVSDSFADIAIDILSRRAKFRGVLTDEKNSSYTGDYSWTEFITTQNISNYMPVGIPQPWPTNQPPAGWLECNGSTFDKNKFPKLANAYPSGKLPDLRGVFIRGKDNLRGLDPYRDILSYQDDAIRNIKGSLPTGNFKALLGHEKIEIGDKNGAISIQSAGNDYLASSASSTNPRQLRWMFFDFDASRVVPTANENRPRNVAFNYIVKAE